MNSNRRKSSGYRAFTLTEMLIVAAIAIVVIVSIPIFIFQRNNLSVNSKHGEYECYYDNDNNIKSVNHSSDKTDEQGEITLDGCKFAPPVGIKKFIVQTIPSTGGGANAFLNTQALYTSELKAGEDLNIFDATNIEDEDEFPNYEIKHPTIGNLKEKKYTNGFFDNYDDESLNQILSRISNKIAENSIEVRLRAPNGVKPVMQYMKPNINYPHFRGLAMFGNITVVDNAITTTSNLPWPNLLRYPHTSGKIDTNSGNAFLTFKEMFINCSSENVNGSQTGRTLDGCYKQCAENRGNTYRAGIIKEIESTADSLTSCDTDIKNCNTYKQTYNYNGENLRLPVYGRTMIVVDKDSTILKKILTNGLGTALSDISSGIINLINQTKFFKETIVGEAIVDFNGYMNILGDALKKLNNSNRITTFRTEPANLSLLNADGTRTTKTYFRNPMTACHFNYFDSNKNGEVTINVLNPETNPQNFIEPTVLNQTFKQSESPHKTFSLGQGTLGANEYPKIAGLQLPRDNFICGVAKADTTILSVIPTETKCYDNIFNCIGTWECIPGIILRCKSYRCTQYEQICKEVPQLAKGFERQTFSLLYNIEDNPISFFYRYATTNKYAPMFEARCYAPNIYDKSTLYVREVADSEATTGGSGAAFSVSRKLINGLEISPYADDGEAKDPRTGDSGHQKSWSRYMINMGQYKTSFEDNDRKQIYNDNSFASDTSTKFYGIRQGLCDGIYRNIKKTKYTGAFEFNSGTDEDKWNLQYLSAFYACTSSETGSAGCPGTSKRSVKNQVIDRVRGADVGVIFKNPDNTTKNYRAEAGASGYNHYYLSELRTDLIDINYTSIVEGQTMNVYKNTAKMSDIWRDIKDMPAQSEETLTLADTNGRILLDGAEISAGTNGVTNLAHIKNSDIKQTKSIQAEIDVLKTQGGGSARFLCDNEGNARSRNFTGTAETPNIEIVPGRIWLKFTSMGKNGISGVQGNDSKTPNEHTKIVNRTGQKSIFDIHLGQGGTITSKDSCTKNNNSGLINEGGILGLGGDEIGYYCNGNEGSPTRIEYNNKQIAEYNGLEGGAGYSKISSIESVIQNLKNEYDKKLADIKFGLGSFRNYPANRLFVQLFYGNDIEHPKCIYDSLDKNCSNEQDPDSTLEADAQPGKGAKVRIIW